MTKHAGVAQTNQAYVLITAAHNEETYIEGTIRSILSQTVQPLKWIIVSDASTDQTDEIVKKYVADNPFIELLRLEAGHHHNFAAQAHAIMAGSDWLKGLQYSFIGTLDADITLDPEYFSKLLDQFRKDPKLGLTGGFIFEEIGGAFASRPGNRTWSVAGATQFFRRECFEAIGGIHPLSYGGHDWYAEVSAHMLGWTSRAIPELRVFHHRPTGTARNLLRHLFRQGKMDFSLGCLPAFVAIKCAGRLGHKPIAIGAIARFAGFASSYWHGLHRAVPEEFVHFLRLDQKRRLVSALNWGRRNRTDAAGNPMEHAGTL
jgi:poly-beta-1,6-N-acetyl-D-glucosamine synthase